MSRIRAPLLVAAGLLGLTLNSATASAPGGGDNRDRRTIEAQILAFNDFHGNLRPPGGSVTLRDGSNIPAGGVEYLDTLVDRMTAENPGGTTVVSAGDLIGASPLLSALFDDEPTIEAMNELGLDLNAVGNHEFDQGIAELLRLQHGGCHPQACADGDGFAGADFGFLAANVLRAESDKHLFPPYEVRDVHGERIAFVGMTLEATPTVTARSGVAGLDFGDEADTVNALLPELRRRGAETVVVLLHEGGVTGGSQRINGCAGISGPIVEIVERTSEEVDLFVTGHTHHPYDCIVDGRPVTSADDSGRLVTDIDMTIERSSGEPTEIAVNNTVVSRELPPAPAQTALIAKYSALSAPIADRVLGQITSDITRGGTPAGESALGDVVADAQLAATHSRRLGGAQVAFVNPGGIRADLFYADDANDTGEGDGYVTYEEVFSVQPFGDKLVTMSFTGAQIERVLEQQWLEQPTPQMLQVSEGFEYAWNPEAPDGNRIDPESVLLDGKSLEPNADYRVTVNRFLAEGGDNFTVLREGTERHDGLQDVDALEAYLAANSPTGPGLRDRIRTR